MKSKLSLTTKIIFFISVFLPGVNLFLGAIMLSQSKNAIQTLIYERMPDISNTAAAYLNGDILKELTADDMGSREHREIMDKLALYQDNFDLKYICCIQDPEDKKASMTIL